FWKEPTPVSIEYPLFSQYSEKRGIHAMGVLTDAILEHKPYPIKGLIVQGANPIVTMANVNRVKKAFKKLDFLAVIDPMMTQTAEFADLVLPASFSFEQTMISNNALSGNNVRLQKKVIEPWGDSLPDWEIVFQIARRLGFEKEFPWKNVEEAIDDQLQPSSVTVKELNRSPEGFLLEKVRYQKYLQGGFKTPSKKVEIESSLLKKFGYPAIPEFRDYFSYQRPSFYEKRDDYPLIGLSGRRSNHFVHSQFRHIKSLREKEDIPKVDINPEDAKERNIHQDDLIVISTPNGSIKLRARISSIIVPGIIRIAWGWGEYREKYNLNLLTDDSLKDPITSTTSNRVFMCQIKKINNNDLLK
ncbi:MAG TPA: molybdopterin-dependent oxidoreductase, partial [Atribacterota bacterium]|nr:molybdopterin-dependent oxidoreductase [Atribacterota bacterium]